MKKPFVISLASHLILFCIAALTLGAEGADGTGSKKTKGNGKGGDDKEFLPKETKHDTINIVIVDDLGTEKKKKKDKKGENCGDNWYGGIGVKTGFYGTITDVAPGYVAERSGLKVGDTLVDDRQEIRGTPGTPVTIHVNRDGAVLSFTIIREKICLADQ